VAEDPRQVLEVRSGVTDEINGPPRPPTKNWRAEVAEVQQQQAARRPQHRQERAS